MPLELKGFSAHVCCNGAELQLFDMKQENENTVSCWIPSEVGQEFELHWTAATLDTKMRVDVYIDGRIATQSCYGAIPTSSLEGSVRGVYETSQSILPFKFSKLVLTDDDATLSHTDANHDLGSIKISLTRVAGFTLSEKPYKRIGTVGTGPVHEKTKKAGVHTVSLGDETLVEPARFYNAVNVEKEPFANFIFRYRPIELLRANGIAPPQSPRSAQKRKADTDTQEGDGPSDPKRRRSEAPVKAEATSDDEDDDADDVTFLEEQLVLLQTRLAEKRAQRQAKAIVKREPSPVRVPSTSIHEVIDLT
ncbi:hypothetical protein OH77DRAFT_1491573 [Trametes cingulata]|nr:hypothetical protein OH77DRAFT_1491573 [Trametes cingulata]